MPQSAETYKLLKSGHQHEPTSSELRHDWLTDRWVIIAPQRTERPQDFVRRPDQSVGAEGCPFCIGHEKETPPAVATYTPKTNGRRSNWHVRVIPNKFPAVNGLGNLANVSAPLVVGKQEERIDLFRRRGLSGGHEVVVESPEHVQSISALDRTTTSLVFQAYRDRLRYWLDDQEIAYAVLFKNVGQDAGASLVHTHSQLIATDIVPTDIRRSTERMQLFADKESECLHCRMARDELEHGVRIVEETPDFVAFCPFASRTPALVTVLPKVHESQFEHLDEAQTDQLSWLAHRLIRRIERCYPETAYNFVIHTAPGSMRNSDAFHWRLEIFPRLTKVAGFEWGSDCYINPLAPEDAAQSLRAAGV